MVHVVSAVVAEWRTENSQFETDRRLKHPWNSGVVAADVRLTAGKLLLDQSMLAGEPVPQRSRATPVS